MNLKPVLQAILEDYTLPLDGDHGIAHWARVLENGLRLAEATGSTSSSRGNVRCELTALIADAKKRSGQRAAGD